MIFIRPPLFIISIFFASFSFANVISHFDKIKKDPSALYDFLYAMPKGGELHYHLAGGAYPQAMLDLISKSNYCLTNGTFIASKNVTPCDGLESKTIDNQSSIYDQILRSWSMKDFTPGKETGHDHFFNSFGKYMAIIFDYRPELLVDIIQRAATQNEYYLEILTFPDNGASTEFGKLINTNASYEEKRRLLLANPEFQKNINHTVAEAERILTQARAQMGCTPDSKTQECKIQVTFLYYVLREQEINGVFAQALNAFEAVSRSNGYLVGVNLVQAEDGPISLRDYDKQMRIFDFLHTLYPSVHISLHAGELSSDQTQAKYLKSHIRDALLIGHAERIGHGSDIAFEDKAQDTLNYMKEHHIPVEINLTSNKVILNLFGSKHPINDYLNHQVPVVLSTDDEGVLQTNLTHEYVEAVTYQGINYPTLKQINRNTLSYSFLPGASLWKDPTTNVLVPECQDLTSTSCSRYITKNEKARIQWNFEQELTAFEKHYQ